jgi:uncharacterized membrane protein
MLQRVTVILVDLFKKIKVLSLNCFKYETHCVHDGRFFFSEFLLPLAVDVFSLVDIW